MCNYAVLNYKTKPQENTLNKQKDNMKKINEDESQ